jgi:hypothetical protein
MMKGAPGMKGISSGQASFVHARESSSSSRSHHEKERPEDQKKDVDGVCPLHQGSVAQKGSIQKKVSWGESFSLM